MIDQRPAAASGAEYKRARSVRPPAAAASGNTVLLRDGSQVVIRPVRGSDASLLADGFARLSTKSRQQRFLAPKHRLSTAELRYLTHIDHYDHDAIGALDRTGLGVGVARYIRSQRDPRLAEIAVTVVDDWQGRGLGTELTRQLARRAIQAGISSFTALVTPANAAAAGLLRAMRARLTAADQESLEYEILLTSDDDDYGFGALIGLGRI
ncbi:MAG TPA: GNAT family N-acetyltransferase [Streptosporangiaceae bacterium]|jgi:RimJ/RimL family protein N-acetyltransferase|nr:GNAT family N-acetyltransferase [Streptosporangiaceae bacterium]